MGKRIVILGGSFAGLTAAIDLKDRLGDEHEVVVVSRTPDFVFLPSLIWVPFGKRDREDISFPLEPVLAKKGITFRHTAVVSLALHDRRVVTADGPERYDHLVLATGAKPAWDAVPGLGPRGGFTQSIYSLADAELARDAFTAFTQRPGPIVVGAVQGADSFGAAYELALNLAHQLRERGLAQKAPITWITPEPFLAHLGVGGFGNARRVVEQLFARLGIEAITSASVREISAQAVYLDDGRRLPFAWSMLAPPMRGADVIAPLTEICDRHGFVRVDDAYRCPAHPEVYAAGAAVAVDPPEPTPVPCAVPKTGYLSEEMGRVVAYNIAAALHELPPLRLPPAAIGARAVLDAGNTGLIMSADSYLDSRENAFVLPGPEAHWAKVAFEKLFLARRSRGKV